MHLLRWMQYAGISVLSVAGVVVLVAHPWLAIYLVLGCAGIYTYLNRSMTAQLARACAPRQHVL